MHFGVHPLPDPFIDSIWMPDPSFLLSSPCFPLLFFPDRLLVGTQVNIDVFCPYILVKDDKNKDAINQARWKEDVNAMSS